jgi:hypothetical protein
MLTSGRSLRIGVLVAVAATAASAPAAVACNSTGCTETSQLTVPAGGSGETLTDRIPPGATKGSITIKPTDPGDQQVFDSLVDSLLENNPGLIPVKLNRRSQRILSCVYVSYLPFLSNFPDSAPLASASIAQAMFLDACLQLALSFPPMPPAARSARSAKAACARFDAAVTLQVTHRRSGYSGTMIGKARRPSGRSPAVISCRRSGGGLRIDIRPRRRGQKLRKVIGPKLGVAFRNPTNKPVTVRTALTVN